ncbi:MAG: M48 family metalloprotease [Vicinamibacterales bacterium]
MTTWSHQTQLVALLSCFVMSACATNPVTGRKQVALMTEAQEIEMGREADRQVRQEMPIYEDSELQQYVEETGLALARTSHRPNLPWAFAIVDSPAINAFALPGGYIYVTRGLLAYLGDEAQLAGVLGHEIGHVTARHSVEQFTRATGAGIGMTIASIFFPATRPFGDLAATGAGIWFLKYGRDDELQADRLGAEYAAQSGWNPDGVAGMLTTLSRLDDVNGSDRRGIPSWLSTHPEPAARVEQVRTTVEESRALVGNGAGVTRRDEYLRRIDGLAYGDDPREGVVRGSLFLHADLRFALQFPEGWDVVNGADQVVATEPGTSHSMVFDLVRDAQVNRSLEDVATRSMRGAGFTPVERGSSTTINGLSAWVGTFDGTLRGIGQVRSSLAVIQHERSVYRLVGVGPRESFARVERSIADSQRSFRALTRAEAREIGPNRIDFYLVREGDSWQSIAQHAGNGIVRASTLAIMNGFPPAEQPRPGDRIKLVVAG